MVVDFEETHTRFEYLARISPESYGRRLTTFMYLPKVAVEGLGELLNISRSLDELSTYKVWCGVFSPLFRSLMLCDILTYGHIGGIVVLLFDSLHIV